MMGTAPGHLSDMKNRSVLAGVLVALVGVLLPARARAQCCPGYAPATACAGAALTKSRWCIQNSAPTGQAALPQAFCAYGDKVITTLETVFNIKAPSTFEFELDTETGGAHTGTGCNALGDGVAYDAFAGNAYGATGFWGYLLSMHEAINDWTGMSSTGWPTDWWADHQSAFPEPDGLSRHEHDRRRQQRPEPHQGGRGAEEALLSRRRQRRREGRRARQRLRARCRAATGYAGFSHMFALQSGDGVKWDNLGVPNPDVKRSEYVVAYMSLAAGQSVLKTLQGPGANGGGKYLQRHARWPAGDKPYTCTEAHVDAIATAHCSVAANGKKTADCRRCARVTTPTFPSGPCGTTCPSECACDDAEPVRGGVARKSSRLGRRRGW